jgi:DNA-binding MltR family transcriptional regulator
MVDGSKGKFTSIPTNEFVKQLYKKTHSNTALVFCARLEQTLAAIIQENMPRLSETLKDKLFTEGGPLSDFQPKIDIALAMGVIKPDDGRTLHALRGIRNVFAHSDDPDIHFEHESLTKRFDKLPNIGKRKESRTERFLDSCIEQSKALQNSYKTALLVNALRRHKSKTLSNK